MICSGLANELGCFGVVARLRLLLLKLGSYVQCKILTCTRCCSCFCNLWSFWFCAVVCVRPGTFFCQCILFFDWSHYTNTILPSFVASFSFVHSNVQPRSRIVCSTAGDRNFYFLATSGGLLNFLSDALFSIMYYCFALLHIWREKQTCRLLFDQLVRGKFSSENNDVNFYSNLNHCHCVLLLRMCVGVLK